MRICLDLNSVYFTLILYIKKPRVIMCDVSLTRRAHNGENRLAKLVVLALIEPAILGLLISTLDRVTTALPEFLFTANSCFK